MRDGAIPGLIGFHFGIEQIDRNAADIRPPHEHMNGRIEQRNLNSQRFIVSVEHELDGIVSAVQRLFVVFLPAIIADFLRKITARINQAHRDHGNSEVAAFLDVISGEHAQPAGIEAAENDGKHTRRKNRPGALCGVPYSVGEPAGLRCDLGVELGHHSVVIAPEIPDRARHCPEFACGTSASMRNGLWSLSRQAC